jgi:GT2 family glycosyltransferase
VTNSIPIIILNWKGLEDTIECMKSVLGMDYMPHEVILVDNGSGPEEQRELMRLYGDEPDVTIVLNDENKGFTRGNADIVSDILKRDWVPEYVVLLNNDTVIAPDWLVNLATSATSNNADVVSSKMINYYDRSKIDNVGHLMLNTGEILPIGHDEPVENYYESFENMGACGGAVLYRISMIEEMGFFDPHFNTGYEDAEFGLRATLLGYKCIFEPSAKVFHKISRSINKIKNDAFLQRIQTNIFYTYVKLMPLKFLLINTSFALFKYVLLLLIGILTLRFKLLMLHSKTIYRFFSFDLKEALQKRRLFYKKFKNQIHYKNSYMKPAQFFVFHDFKRLVMSTTTS